MVIGIGYVNDIFYTFIFVMFLGLIGIGNTIYYRAGISTVSLLITFGYERSGPTFSMKLRNDLLRSDKRITGKRFWKKWLGMWKKGFEFRKDKYN